MSQATMIKASQIVVEIYRDPRTHEKHYRAVLQLEARRVVGSGLAKAARLSVDKLMRSKLRRQLLAMLYDDIILSLRSAIIIERAPVRETNAELLLLYNRLMILLENA